MPAPETHVRRHGDEHVSARGHHLHDWCQHRGVVGHVLQHVHEQKRPRLAGHVTENSRSLTAEEANVGETPAGEVDGLFGGVDAHTRVAVGEGGDVGAGAAADVDDDRLRPRGQHAGEDVAHDLAAGHEPPVRQVDGGDDLVVDRLHETLL